MSYLGNGSSTVRLEYYDIASDPSQSKTNFYFTSCKNTYGFPEDVRSIQPAYSANSTNSWMYYNNIHLGFEIFNDVGNTSYETKNILFGYGIFLFVQNGWFPNTYRFQSVVPPNLYIIASDGALTFGLYDGSTQFQQNASFVIHGDITPTPTPQVNSSITIGIGIGVGFVIVFIYMAIKRVFGWRD